MPWCSATRDSPNGSPTVNRSPPAAVKRASGIIGTASGNRCTCTAAELPAAQQQGPAVAVQRHARPPRRRPRHPQPQAIKKPPLRVAFSSPMHGVITITPHELESCGAKNVLPGIDLFSQGATPQISSALHRFTAEFEMDRSGSNAPWTPG